MYPRVMTRRVSSKARRGPDSPPAGGPPQGIRTIRFGDGLVRMGQVRAEREGTTFAMLVKKALVVYLGMERR